VHKIALTGEPGEDLRIYQMPQVDREASVFETSRLMRASGATRVLVTDATGGNRRGIGILTADDIIRQVVATGLDPSVMTAGDIATRNLR